MNSSTDWEKFASSIGLTTAKLKGTAWYDFEEFIIKGITFSYQSSRLFTSLFFVVKSALNILSPTKLFKISNKLFTKNKEWKILGFLIESSLGETRNKTQWKNFLKKIREKTNRNKEQLFKVKAFRENKELLKWFLSSDKLDLTNKSKYLKEDLFFNHPLIKNRHLGTKAVYSDILFYRLVNKEEISLRQLSQKINHDPAQVSEACANILLTLPQK